MVTREVEGREEPEAAETVAAALINMGAFDAGFVPIGSFSLLVFGY